MPDNDLSVSMDKWTTEKVNELVKMMDNGVNSKNNPFLDGKIEWRKGNILFEYTENELAEIKKCASDVIYFANKYCYSMTDEGIALLKVRDYQEDMLRDFQENRFCIAMQPRQSGKAQPLDSIVWKESGKTKFGELMVGDQIYDANGKLTNVIGIYPQGERDVYELTFADGTTARSCQEHLWTVEKNDGNIRTLQLKDIIKDGILTNRGDYKWFVKTTEPVQFPEADLPMDPYFLGLLIGDGGIAHNNIGFATIDDEILNYLKENVLEHFDVPLKQFPSSRSFEYTMVRNIGGTKSNITDILRELDLMGKKSDKKFIPKKYLYGSIPQRLSILQGLMDTDGSITENSGIEFSTASERLGNDVQQLCESLGIVVRRTIKNTHYIDTDGVKINCLQAHRLKLQLPNDYPYPIFRLTRKQSRVRNKKYDWGKYRGIAKVELVGKEKVQCIMVDNEDHLYLTDHFIPTHNTITTSIFLTWYLLFNTDKNLMVLANNGTTAEELIDKIKVILANLPFFLKPGMLVNNVMSMKFDNGCRLFGRTTTKTSGIGMTIHFLYVDEFANIQPNFIDPFWRAVYPTLSASKISRCIITSTPNGMNKFYEIYTGAMKVKGELGKNEFKAIRVDWWQVPGRDEAWREREIGNLGSEEDFNQEYGLQFLSSSKLLLDGQTLRGLKQLINEYKWIEIGDLHDIDADYENLRWHPKFNIDNIQETDQFVITIDTSGGGGGDYTVLNIFKLIPMPVNIIKSKIGYADEADFFSLLQVGLFRNNNQTIEEVLPILETIIYKVIGPEQVKIVLEMDFKGELLFEKMSNHKEFFEDMFIHTKHSEKAKRLTPGIKLNPKNKYEYCVEMRRLVKHGRILPNEKTTFDELSAFGMNKKGSYSSQIGHDDIAMSVVNMNTFFSSPQYYEMIESVYDTLEDTYKKAIEEKLNNPADDDKSKKEDYSIFKDMLN